ncbi:MAG: ATP-binding protein [Anaerolineales bacterium]|nr:ATP-binding protein [Anaerolineales bacterium]
MPKQWELTVDGRLENLATIADFVIKAAQASGLNDKATFEVQMAVDEACANVIKHGYGYGEEDKAKVALCCECADGDFVVTIRDHGQPFDPDAVPPPDLKCCLVERCNGGLGLYFMRRLMDEVCFHFDAEGNKLTMIKRIRR